MTEALPRFCEQAVHAALKKKAENVLVLDVRSHCDYTSYIMICHGEVAAQVQAVAEAILEHLQNLIELHHVEGWREGRWIVLDYYDLVIHVFEETARAYYNIEAFWGEVPHYLYREDGTCVVLEPDSENATILS